MREDYCDRVSEMDNECVMVVERERRERGGRKRAFKFLHAARER